MRVIDNSRLRVRHIRRATAADRGAVQVLGGWWAPAGDGIEGRQGWQSANVERRLTDHGTLQSLALPNAAGDDGQLHRDRFAVRTDPAYRLGTEWIEFRDADTGRPLFVATPDSARVDGTTVALTGVDAAGLLGNFREGKVAPWTPHGPLDVIDWYSRSPQQLVSDEFRGNANLYPWTNTGGQTVNPSDAGMQVRGVGVTSTAERPIARPTGAGDAWAATVQLILLTGNLGGFTITDAAGAMLADVEMQVLSGNRWQVGLTATYATGSTMAIAGTFQGTAPGSGLEVQLLARDGWFYLVCDGQVCAQLRMAGLSRGSAGRLRVRQSGPNAMVVQSFAFTTLRPFLRRGAPAPDYRVAGAPTAGGLRGDYFLTYDEYVRSGGNFAGYGAQVPAPLAEPYQRRLDPVIDFTGSPPTWQPPGPPNGEGFAVRWSGAIRLQLATAPNTRLRLANVDDMARMWLGDTTAGHQYVDLWGLGAAGTQAGVYATAHLGQSDTGWYPLVIEYAQGPNGAAGLQLQSTTDGVTWTTVPATALSPYGCWEGDLGNESHREAIDGVCTSMGLTWRLQPKTLESGEFPGRLEAAARIGVDTDYQLTEDEATEYASEMAAAETADRILADAAGLGDNLGREGLTAELIDPAVVGQPWVTTRYESLGDITEDTLLRQRLSSLLALYGTPMETVAARPRGQDELVREYTDTFPLVGDARLFLWEPDDGIRLALPTIGVEDRTPRRITSVAWPLTPDGRGAPAVGFRQRPKHLRATLQRLMRQAAVSRRHYQGQLAQVSGSLGGNVTGSGDAFSRLGVAQGAVASLTARALGIVGGSGVLEVNGTSTGLTLTRDGDYDVTAWLRTGTTQQEARLVSLTSGATYLLQLVATVRV